MRRSTALLALAAALACAPPPHVLRAQGGDYGDYTAPRNATVDARGARRVEIEGRSGILRVTGVDGLGEVRVRGTARASREAWLADIKLVARREGDVVIVQADIPDMEWRDSHGWGNNTRALDLVIEVPKGIATRVEDGSGEAEIRGVGALDVRDGSGTLEIEDVASATVVDGSGELRVRTVRGDVRVTDGSGAITVEDVTGTVTIDEDGSGEIEVERVRGAVTVGEDGSGSIGVRNVGGDFVVRRDASGGIDYADVRGRVDVPRRSRR